MQNFQPLTGSPKQVAWANTIREQACAAMSTALAACEAHIRYEHDDLPEENILGIMEIVRAHVAEQMANTSAAWWIDNRGMAIGHNAPVNSPMAENNGLALWNAVRASARKNGTAARLAELLCL